MAVVNTYIKARIDENTKAMANETLASMGLTMSDAIRIFLKRVIADGAMPFEIKSPNATTIKSFDNYKKGQVLETKDIDALMKDLNA